MGNRQTKITFRFFAPDDYEKEEKYLRNMSLQGWHFKKIIFMFYQFEKGQPKNYYYQMDYIENTKKDNGEYLQIFSDDNWEHIFQSPNTYGAWVYFRKESEDERELSIYTDVESKIDMLIRLRKPFSISYAIMMTYCFIPKFFKLLEPTFSGDFLFIPLLPICIISAILYLRLSLKIKQLRKK